MPINKKILYFLGTDEESDWVGILRVLETEPAPDFGFTPDAEFQYLHGEKGIASFEIVTKHIAADTADSTLKLFSAGIRHNMVPTEDKADYCGPLPEAFMTTAEKWAAETEVAHSLTPGHPTTIELIGKGAHATEHKDGQNADTVLDTLLADLPFDPAGKAVLTMIAHHLLSDTRGLHLGINYTDKSMGDLTDSPDIYSFTTDGPTSVLVHVRVPTGTDAAQIRELIETASGAEL